MNKSKRNLYLVALSIFAIALVSFGTYAAWDLGEGLFTNENTITSGQVTMSFSEKNEITLNNVLPMNDEDGKGLDEYFDFSVSSHIKTRQDDSTSRKLYYNIFLEKLGATGGTTALNDSEIKVYLTEVASNGSETQVLAPTTIDKLNNYLLTSGEEEFKNAKARVEKNFRLRAWLDFGVDASKFNGATAYSYNFRVNVNNEKPEPMNTTEFALAKVGTGGLEEITYTVSAGDALQVPTGTLTEYRYRGASDSVNNYVTFNNETWRIIGIFPTDDGTGHIENRIKIIKPTSLGDMSWDCKTGDCFSQLSSTSNVVAEDLINRNNNINLVPLATVSEDVNNWAHPSTLNTYLNSSYYNTLSEEAKSMISPTKYYLGGYNGVNIRIGAMWQAERRISGSNYYYSDNANSHTGNIAIMYASDFRYAATGCDDSYLYDSSGNDIRTCKDNNWLYFGEDEWLLPQYAGNSANAFYVNSSGYISYSFINNPYAVRPVLSLSSNVKIVGGTGVPGDEYQLEI